MKGKTLQEIQFSEYMESVRSKKIIFIDENPTFTKPKKYVSVEDYNTLHSLAKEMFEQLELMDYEVKAKETYDEFKAELKNSEVIVDEETI